jgi:hypothetical protein
MAGQQVHAENYSHMLDPAVGIEKAATYGSHILSLRVFD